MKRGYYSWTIILGILSILLLSCQDRRTSEELSKTIVVLPFINDSPDKDNEYFIDGIMESILSNLSKIENLRVISRTSAAPYRNSQKTISEIAEELNVRFVLEGSVKKDGDKIRVQIQLIDALNEKHLWASTYDRMGEEIFAFQVEIAQHVAKEIDALIIPKE